MVNYKFAISGKANSGKNTLTKMILQALMDDNGDLNATTIAFADPIKEIVLKMYPHLNKDWLYGSSNLRSSIIKGEFKGGVPLTVRQVLLDIGKLGRSYNKNMWVNAFKERYDKIKDKSIVFVPDVRFVNEMNYLKSEHFFTIRLLRSESLDINDESEKEQDSIPSNTFNAIVSNDGNLHDLRKKVNLLVKSSLL